MENFLSKITVKVCMAKFESNGSESDNESDSDSA